MVEVVTHAPEIEEDMALSNLALDLIGQARALYSYAGEIEGLVGRGRSRRGSSCLLREQHEFLNVRCW